jgi:general secretion pathway protein G
MRIRFATAHGRAAVVRGFTLLELLLVVTLVGLLAGVAVPAYRGYVQRAQEAQALADIGTLALGLKRWETNTGAYPATLAAANLDGLTDPWGNPYRYLNMDGANVGDMRKDKNLIPINTDYDLYSMGPDGETSPALTAQNARDDIIRAANGSFFGRASEY